MKDTAINTKELENKARRIVALAARFALALHQRRPMQPHGCGEGMAWRKNWALEHNQPCLRWLGLENKAQQLQPATARKM